MLHTLQSFLRISRKKERTLVDSYMNALAVKAPSMEQLTKNLSGGNQQKVVVAKWLATNADIIILDEPTRGIDKIRNLPHYEPAGQRRKIDHHDFLRNAGADRHE